MRIFTDDPAVYLPHLGMLFGGAVLLFFGVRIVLFSVGSSWFDVMGQWAVGACFLFFGWFFVTNFAVYFFGPHSMVELWTTSY
ncbi:MAG: hypothetical protein [Siphoviridae sp. ctpQM7]|nr:MAG: hypothetical protein [Siphoviridae sp. ctpQM7]